MPHNKSFSEVLPTLQTKIDSTSLTEFKVCPKRYFYKIVLGRSPSVESAHLTFGILLHKSLELYHHVRFKGTSHDEALLSIIKWAMKATWDYQLNRPWVSDNKNKNRLTLIRTIVWYLDEHEHDPLVTALVRGKPAVELPFTMDSGYIASTGEEFMLCGTLDRIVIHENNYYVTDVKTTQSAISSWWFQKFTPDNQVTMYSMAGKLAFDKEISGLIIDGCQISVEFSRFERGFIERSESQVYEWQQDLNYWLMNLNQCAQAGYWPRNDSACNLYGGCPYRRVCSQSNPDASDKMLYGTYIENIWDPASRRNDY